MGFSERLLRTKARKMVNHFCENILYFIRKYNRNLSRWSWFFVRPLADGVGSSYFQDSKYQLVLSIGGIWASNSLASLRYEGWNIFDVIENSENTIVNYPPILGTQWENLRGPRNFDLVRKNGVSDGSVPAKSLMHHGTAMRSQNFKRFGAVLPTQRGF